MDGVQQERYLNAVLRQIPAAVWATDQDLRVTYALGHVPRLAGVNPKREIGRTVQEVVGASDPTDPIVAHHLAAADEPTGGTAII